MQNVDKSTSHSDVSGRLFKNTAVNFVGQIFLLALNLATAPYVVHHLGAELFGIVALVQTTAGFAGFLNLGIGRALTKYISALHWKGEIGSINRLFQTAWTICLASGLIALIAISGPKEIIGRLLLHDSSGNSSVSDFAIYIAALGLFSSILLEGISGIPGALNRFDLINWINIATGILRAMGSVVVLALGLSIRAVLLVNLISSIFSIIAFAVISRQLLPGLQFRPRFDWNAFKRLFDFSLPLLLSALSALIVTRMDRFILAYYLPLAAITYYALPYSLSEKFAMGVSNVTSVVLPYASELHSMEAHAQVHELYLRSTKIMTLVTMPLTTILLAVSEPILRLWLGQEYATQGHVALTILGLATYLNAASAIPTVTTLGVGRVWIPTAYALTTSVINIVANFILIPRYGINGAAWGLLLPQAIILPVFVLHVNHILRFSSLKLIVEAYLRPLVCSIGQFAVLFALKEYASNLLTLALLCLTSLGVFGVFAIHLGVINKDERLVLTKITEKLRFSRKPISQGN